MKIKLHKIAFIPCLLLLTLSCGRSMKENTFIVSIDPQRYLLEQIVGDKFDVVTMLTPGSNPETFEPGISSRQKLDKSMAFFVTGHLPFEKQLISSLDDNTPVINTSEGIKPVYGTHGHDHEGHHHDDGADPHVWTSVKNAKIMAATMYEAVAALDDTNKDYYTTRYEGLINRLDSLDAAFTEKLSQPGAQKAFAIWHPSLSYLARDYGLEQIAVGYENKEMPAASLRKIIDEVRADSVKTFFFQKEFDSRQAATLNKEMGTELITINPLDYDWTGQLDTIVSALCR